MLGLTAWYGGHGLVEAISSAMMKAIELNAEYLGVSRLQLMETAGYALAREIKSRFKPSEAGVAIYAGLGGNGGDGFVVARHLAGLGFKVDVILAGKPSEIEDPASKKNWECLQLLDHSITTHVAYDSSLIPKLEATVIVDALLGIGVSGGLRQPMLQMVKAINRRSGFKLAVDVPTGIDSDSGEVLGEAVKADLTVTFHRPKTGLLKAKKHVGKLVIANLGIPPEAELYAGPGDVSLVWKPRPLVAHKGDFGRLLVIGGSETFSGAPALAALSALRTGVDLVYVAAPRDTAYVIAAMSPDLITVKLEGSQLDSRSVGVIEDLLDKATAVVMGPGLGLHRDTVSAVKQLFNLIGKRRVPLLLDADALKAFAEFKHRVNFPVVLTPHLGEYRILTGTDSPNDLSARVEHVCRFARELGVVILLKGHIDVISDGITTKLNLTGNPGMTVGGTGDTLAGIIGALLAQGFNPFLAAVAGAFINGAAGDFVRAERGYHMVPTDVIDWISRVMEDPMRHVKVRKW